MMGTSDSALSPVTNGSRRRFLRLCGGTSAMVAGMTLLSGCDDDVIGSEVLPAAERPSVTAPPPGYTATDADRLNLLLQFHYLLGGYMLAGVRGTTLPAAMTAGTGTAGTVSGGRKVTLTDPMLVGQLDEVIGDLMQHIALVRRLIGTGVTAQPAINIAGGEGSPFQAITVPVRPANAPPPEPSTKPPTFFDPYASAVDFLLGAIVLSGVAATTIAEMSRVVGGTLGTQITALASSAGARDGVLRGALYKLALAEIDLPEEEHGDPTIYGRSAQISNAVDTFDSDRDLDQDIGWEWYANILASDASYNALRRTPEQALAVVYASAKPVSSGAFFPAGVNGLIRTSGSNVVS